MRELTYAEALREGLRQAMQADPCVFVMGEDIGVYGGAFGVTAGLINEFGPERIIDTPISEAGIAGACVGAALSGMRPVGEIQFMDFVTLSMEQLVLQAAKVRFMFGGKASVPMVLRMPGGSGTGAAVVVVVVGESSSAPAGPATSQEPSTAAIVPAATAASTRRFQSASPNRSRPPRMSMRLT